MKHPEGPSDFDPRAYRSALGGFGTGVALVAARDEAGNAHGMIINSLTSVSLHPPIMLWCLANSSAAFKVFTEAPAFSLNILRSDDAEVAQRFVGKMMQYEAAHAGIGVDIWQGLKKIPTDPLDADRQVGGPLNQVETGHGGGGERGLDFAAQVAFAGADFNDPGWGRGLLLELPHDPS
jgi:hypothetical protein